jgi:hypothetical protein
VQTLPAPQVSTVQSKESSHCALVVQVRIVEQPTPTTQLSPAPVHTASIGVYAHSMSTPHVSTVHSIESLHSEFVVHRRPPMPASVSVPLRLPHAERARQPPSASIVTRAEALRAVRMESPWKSEARGRRAVLVEGQRSSVTERV